MGWPVESYGGILRNPFFCAMVYATWEGENLPTSASLFSTNSFNIFVQVILLIYWVVIWTVKIFYHILFTFYMVQLFDTQPTNSSNTQFVLVWVVPTILRHHTHTQLPLEINTDLNSIMHQLNTLTRVFMPLEVHMTFRNTML